MPTENILLSVSLPLRLGVDGASESLGLEQRRSATTFFGLVATQNIKEQKCAGHVGASGNCTYMNHPSVHLLTLGPSVVARNTKGSFHFFYFDNMLETSFMRCGVEARPGVDGALKIEVYMCIG